MDVDLVESLADKGNSSGGVIRVRQGWGGGQFRLIEKGIVIVDEELFMVYMRCAIRGMAFRRLCQSNEMMSVK